MFATTGHEKHRMRKAAFNPFFSTASVKRSQPMIEERMAKLLDRFEGFKRDDEGVSLSLGYAAYTNGMC